MTESIGADPRVESAPLFARGRFLTLILFFSALCCARSVRSQTVATPPPPVTYFDAAKDPDFQQYKTVLHHWSERHPHRGGNDFCVLGQDAGGGAKSAWVVWPQGAEIFQWGGLGSPLDTPQTLHLTTDVVATEDQIHGSTYLVTRAWVEHLRTTCEAQGIKLHFASGH